MGWFLDGRVTAVVGTHTHVPTADARVLPGGTAYITDVGMTGPRGGVIGVRKEQAIESLRTHMSVRFETVRGRPVAHGRARALRATRRCARRRSSSCCCRWSPARPPERRIAWAWPPPQRQATAGAGSRPSCST